MRVIKYQRSQHNKIIRDCVNTLKRGMVVAYPTDTSYGLAVDAKNSKAIKKLYCVKERKKGLPVHVVVPSVAYAKKIVKWNIIASKLAKRYLPGQLTLILPLKSKDKGLRILSARTGTLGVRMPKNEIAMDLVKHLKSPITTTSANPSNSKGGYDSYNVANILKQFAKKKYKPDIILDAGRLPKRKPSTMIKILVNQITILRKGSITKNQINKLLKH